MTEKFANGNATELATFLPQDNSTTNGVTKYKVNKNNDLEAQEVDPFKNRKLEHPVSDINTLTHLLKAALGTGILSMPAAFMNAGLGLGIIGTILVAVVCTHAAYILVICAHELYRRTGKNSMSFAEVAEAACANGPQWAKKFGAPLKMLVLVLLFVTYFATCSCYSVIVAKNFNYVANYYLGYEVNIRVTIAILLAPIILLVYVPNLKYLAPISMLANGLMVVGLGITLYYLMVNIPPISSRDMVADIFNFPVFMSITIFAIEAIGVVMPLENHMANPTHFVGICGVLNQGMSGVTLMYILVGFFGYLKYGNETKGSITLNLPQEDIAAQIVNIVIGLAVFCTFGLQFYVCLEICWNGVKDKLSNPSLVANYIMRTILTVICIAIAIAVPTIIPFVSLIGAFCFSILGIMTPIFLEIITFWGKGFGPCNWKIFKDIVVVIVGIIALVFGSKMAIEEIVGMYK